MQTNAFEDTLFSGGESQTSIKKHPFFGMTKNGCGIKNILMSVYKVEFFKRRDYFSAHRQKSHILSLESSHKRHCHNKNYNSGKNGYDGTDRIERKYIYSPLYIPRQHTPIIKEAARGLKSIEPKSNFMPVAFLRAPILSTAATA